MARGADKLDNFVCKKTKVAKSNLQSLQSFVPHGEVSDVAVLRYTCDGAWCRLYLGCSGGTNSPSSSIVWPVSCTVFLISYFSGNRQEPCNLLQAFGRGEA